MQNEVVRQFFQNYLLIREQGFGAFRREQSKLLSPDLVTVVSDTRGTFTYHGIDEFFEGMIAWSRHYFVNGKTRHEFVQEMPENVFVQMHGELRLLEAVNGATHSGEDDHEWTEEFELSDGLITRFEVELFFHQPA